MDVWGLFFHHSMPFFLVNYMTIIILVIKKSYVLPQSWLGKWRIPTFCMGICPRKWLWRTQQGLDIGTPTYNSVLFSFSSKLSSWHFQAVTRIGTNNSKLKEHFKSKMINKLMCFRKGYLEQHISMKKYGFLRNSLFTNACTC